MLCFTIYNPHFIDGHLSELFVFVHLVNMIIQLKHLAQLYRQMMTNDQWIELEGA